MVKKLIGLAIGVAFLAGCGGGPDVPDTVPVSGTVHLDGEPLAGAEVNFVSEEFAASGVTGADGRYELPTGAVPGENRVYIKRFEGVDLASDPEAAIEGAEDIGQLEAQRDPASGGSAVAAGPKQLIPAKYSDPNQTTLKFPVPEGGTDSANFRLSSE